MSEFSERSRKIAQSTEIMMETVRAEAVQLLDQIDEADAKFEEQAVTIASLQETVAMQQAEINRISVDYQDKIDRLSDENTALRSRLNTKDKDFSVLSRAVGDMMTSAKRVAAVGAHAFNIIRGDSMGDKLVTQLHQHRQPQQQKSAAPDDDGGPVFRPDESPYAPRPRQASAR